MKPVFTAAKESPPPHRLSPTARTSACCARRRCLVDEGLATPILVGRPAVIERRLERAGLRIKAGKDFEIVNPEDDPRFREYWSTYHSLTERKGVSQQYAKLEMRRRTTLIGAMMVHLGQADGLVCGLIGSYKTHLHYVDQVLGKRAGIANYYAMNMVMLPRRTLFLCDTYVNLDPTPSRSWRWWGSPRTRSRASGSRPRWRSSRIRRSATATHPRGEDAPGAGAHPRTLPRPRGRG
jgi:malate dehydrogenase (oxaloacetate-decarboxylating)(NADP+)